MSEKPGATTGGEQPSRTEVRHVTVRLRRPGVAALWAWLLPGAGHWYQGRRTKAAIYSVCILSVYFFGLALGGGHVVYASFAKGNVRKSYFCQIGVGIPAFPALIQTYRVSNGKPPLLGDIMAPPGKVQDRVKDKLARWHEKYGDKFEIGTLYTMVAGLMNVWAILDAYGGPVGYSEESGSQPSKSENEGENQPRSSDNEKRRRKKRR